MRKRDNAIAQLGVELRRNTGSAMDLSTNANDDLNFGDSENDYLEMMKARIKGGVPSQTLSGKRKTLDCEA